MTASPWFRPSCAIIIPTLALRERADSLERAIESTRSGNECPPKVLVVVNGQRFDASLVAGLRARQDIQLLQISTPSSPAAILAGRKAITTPFFGFLDDDDEYLPGAVDARLEAMAAHPEASVVITNGYHHRLGEDSLDVEYLANLSDDPLAALFRENWLASCGGLYRTDHIPVEFFEDSPRHIHWTWLAFRLVEAGKRIVALDVPTYRINDTLDSSSKSKEYMLCHLDLYRRMLERVSRPDIVRILRARLCQASHEISAYYLKQGSLQAAWSAHLSSLGHRSGWKFLPYSRKFIFARAGRDE